MLILKTILSLQRFIIYENLSAKKVFIINEISNIKGGDKLIKKLVKSKARKLSKL